MDTNRRRDELTRYSLPASGITVFTAKDILDNESPDWNSIRFQLHQSAAVFEKAFFSLHIKKKPTYTIAQKERAIRFFISAYLITSDIRYFNEYLWFSENGTTHNDYHEIAVAHFRSNCGKDGYHRIHPDELNETAQLLKQNPLSKASSNPDTKLKICLIGNPVFFGKIHRELEKAGFHVEQFFIPYHPNKYLRFVAGNPLLIKAAAVLKGNPYRFETLNYDPKDERIKTILDSRGFDIGFHKLNFIIRKNIIDSFRIALINDHWGMLPFLRGKSTIAWSVLLGFPVVPSLHFTEPGIDSGPIIGFDSLNFDGIKTLGGIRTKIRETLSSRVIRAIRYLASPEFSPVKNDPLKGRTY